MTSPKSEREQAVLAEIDEMAAHWWLQQQAGMSQQASARLSAWLRQDPRHATALAAMTDTAASLDRLPSAARGKTRQPRWGYAAGPSVRLLSLAACVMLSVVVGWQWYAAPLSEAQAQTGRGELKELALADGSLVALDAASGIRVGLYRNRREVFLEQGQALFDVRREGARPFQVVAGDVRVTVLGTRFNVRRDGDATVVTVAEGRVEVGSHGHRHLLNAGDELLIRRDHSTDLRYRAIPLIAAWREHRLIFDNTPLAKALDEFSRYGEMSVRLSDRRLDALRITGSFDARSPEQFIAALPLALPVTVEKNGKVLLVRYRE